MTRATVTLRDVAREAGVSPMTASNALHGKPGVRASTRDKVLAAARKLDYRINLTASMLRSGRSGIIHIVVNEFDSPFYSKLVQAMADETKARGLTPFLEQTRYSPDEARHALESSPFSDQLFDGEIIHASGMGPAEPIARMVSGRPFVLIDSCERNPTTDQVNFPNEEGAREAVRHLVERGCRRIAIVGHGYRARGELASLPGAFPLRLLGASGALLDAGQAYGPTTTFPGAGATEGIEAGHAIADRIAAGDCFDGVCCITDYAAFGVIRGLKDRGLDVPGDLRVIGFDGARADAWSTPSLSTIEVDLNQLARHALDLLARRIERRHAGLADEPPAKLTFGYRLVPRESTR